MLVLEADGHLVISLKIDKECVKQFKIVSRSMDS